MNQREPKNIDPNTADADTLRQIPGIGAVMSQRIVTARPFERAEDLTRVSGIGPNVLERLKPHLALQSTQDALSTGDTGAESFAGAEGETVDSEGTATEEEVIDQMDLVEAKAPPLETEGSEPVAPPEAPPEETTPEEVAPPPPQRPSMTPGHVRWLVAISGLLALSLALVLSLGILATLNDGQLQFVSPSQLGTLTVRVEGLETQSEDLRQDIAGLRTRLNNLEALSGRMDTVEQTTDELRTDLNAASAQAEELSGLVNDLDTELTNLTQQLSDVEAEVEDLHAQSDHFQSFLDGLRDLMETLFSPEGGTP